MTSIKPMGHGFSIILPEAKPDATPFHQAIENGREVQWIAYDNPNNVDVEIENDFTVEITFDKVGARENQPIVPTLNNLYNAIEVYVIPLRRRATCRSKPRLHPCQSKKPSISFPPFQLD